MFVESMSRHSQENHSISTSRDRRKKLYHSQNFSCGCDFLRVTFPSERKGLTGYRSEEISHEQHNKKKPLSRRGRGASLHLGSFPSSALALLLFLLRESPLFFFLCRLPSFQLRKAMPPRSFSLLVLASAFIVCTHAIGEKG